MDCLTTEQRVKLIEFYFKNDESLVRARRAYCRHFEVRSGPSESTISRLVQKFKDSGSVHDLPRSGRPKTRTEECIEQVRASVEEDPQTSTRRRSSQLNMAHSSLYRILRMDLNLLPYKIQVVHNFCLTTCNGDCSMRLASNNMHELTHISPIISSCQMKLIFTWTAA